MARYSEAPLRGALNDPCPVCCLIPVKALNYGTPDDGANPDEGAITVCFGCGLVQRIHDGMRCALSEGEAEWLFDRMDVIQHVVMIAKMRAKAPMRVSELVREQQERKRQ